MITPVYNASSFIADTIHNIEPQLTNDVEWIIINDGSTDQTLRVLKEEIGNNLNIKIITTKNKGAGHARNVGLNEAEGEWISFLDADDLYTSDAIINIINYIIQNSNNCDIIYTPKIYSSFDLKKQKILWPEESISNDMPMLEFVTSLYRRDFLNKNNIRFFEFKQQDIESAFRYLAFSQVSNLTITKQLIFYCHRNNPTSNTHTWNHAVLFYTKAKVYYLIYKRFKKENKESLKYIKQIYCDCIREIVNNRLYFSLSLSECLVLIKDNIIIANKLDNNLKTEILVNTKKLIRHILKNK